MVEGDFHVLVELFGKGVAVVDPEDAFEDIEVDGDVQIFPGVMIAEFSDNSGYFLSFEEDSLRDS